MSHTVTYLNTGAIPPSIDTITSGSEPTISPDYDCAVNGETNIQILITATGNYPVAITSESISGTDASQFFLRTISPSSLNTSNLTEQLHIVPIMFRPTSSGVKNAVYNVTVEGTSYAIPISATPQTATLQIKAIGGLTPSYTREAPCVIMARVDMLNSALPAPLSECYFRWVVTPPNSETFVVQSQRPNDSSNYNLFNHFPGPSIAIPVLEGQHGSWSMVCYGYVPGDDGNTPSYTSNTLNITVNALGTAKTTKHVSTNGSGDFSGSDTSNKMSYSGMRTDLAGAPAVANNRHYILYDDDGEFLHSDKLALASVENVSIVKASGDTPTLRNSDGTLLKETVELISPKGLFIQGITLDPTGAGLQVAVDTQYPENACFYDCHALGDGLSGGAHVGDSFRFIFSCGNDTAYPTPMTQWPNGLAIINCTGQETEAYSIAGSHEALVEVGTHFKPSRDESCFRALQQFGYPNGIETRPFQDKGAWYYNAVLCKHDMQHASSSNKSTWRFYGGNFNETHLCYSNGYIWAPMDNNADTPSDLNFTDNLKFCHLYMNSQNIDGMEFKSGSGNLALIGSFLTRSFNTAILEFTDFIKILNCTFYAPTGTAKMIIGSNIMSYGNQNDTRVSGEFKHNIVIADLDTTGGLIFDDGLISGSRWPHTATNSIVNNIFPSTFRRNYDVMGSTHSSISALNATSQASGNIEQDITLDANGRPNEDVSSLGRDSRYYFDYFLKPLTSGDTWAGMTQSAQTLTRMRIRS